MDVIQGVQDYIVRMLDSVRGMKVILLDSETMGILSLVYSQSEVLQKDVYLFDLITNPNRAQMAHLKALVFIRPTRENINLICEELQNPKYVQYHLCKLFSFFKTHKNNHSPLNKYKKSFFKHITTIIFGGNSSM